MPVGRRNLNHHHIAGEHAFPEKTLGLVKRNRDIVRKTIRDMAADVAIQKETFGFQHPVVGRAAVG